MPSTPPCQPALGWQQCHAQSLCSHLQSLATQDVMFSDI